MTESQVIMYGADWCGDCIRSKRVLDEIGVPYAYVNLVETPEAADTAEQISGRKNIPVVVMPDGSHLVEPTDSELRSSLESNGLL
ncbi:glutaredoxin family protein [Galactobacter caseinivorans]|uniref:NrdH-redoxin n=1 Tax=Galactobacter caseinivorans TaxID=2676123 RepID=A0A496PIY4_9MICC|nr:glutaredoxin domain-containing protein [Galactobacter caseinivorans]RKW70454.1 NrdH-redoxin [Galactobacter caseinivorans]